MKPNLGTDQDHVVVHQGVGIFHDPEGKTPRAWVDHKKGEVLTPDELEHTDVARLVELGALRPHSSDEGEVESDEDGESADYATWSKDALVEEAGERGLAVSGTKAELVQRLEEHDASATERVPEAGGAITPEAN